jgi:putative protease
MTGIRTEEDKRISESEEKGDFTSYDRIRVKARVRMVLGEPSEMILYSENGAREARAVGDEPSPAINAPLTQGGVKERLSKMGNTFLSLDRDDIELELGDGINLSPSVINKLRRDAAERLEDCSRELPEDNGDAKNTSLGKVSRSEKIRRTAIFFGTESLLRLEEGARNYFDAIFVPLAEYPSCRETANGVYIPPVIMEHELTRVKKMILEAKESGAKYALLGNPSHLALANEAGLSPIGDFRLNVTNARSLSEWFRLGVSDVIVSPELTARQARALGGRAVVYGRIPLMLTERCFMKENFGCDKCGRCTLVDRKGIKFPMMREFEHRNVIFNSAVTYMGDRLDEIAGVGEHHFIFTTERVDEVRTVVEAFKSHRPFPLQGQFRRMGKRKLESK